MDVKIKGLNPSIVTNLSLSSEQDLCKYFTNLANGSGAVVEHLTMDVKIKGQNPATIRNLRLSLEQDLCNYFTNLANGSSTVVEHLTMDVKIKGLNPSKCESKLRFNGERLQEKNVLIRRPWTKQ